MSNMAFSAIGNNNSDLREKYQNEAKFFFCGQKVFSAFRGHVKLWQTVGEKWVGRKTSNDPYLRLFFSFSSKHLFAGDDTVAIVDVETVS